MVASGILYINQCNSSLATSSLGSGLYKLISDKITSLFSICIFILSLLFPNISLAKPLSAVIVVDADSGKVVLAQNADIAVYPASLTKMMTLYIVFDALKHGRLSPSQMMKVSKLAASQQPTKLGLRVGKKISVRDAVMGLITASANDAAVVLAEAIAGSQTAFAKIMTSKARRLGMRSTTFYNANGLPNFRQKTTARDMALLGIALRRDYPSYFKYFAQQTWTYKGSLLYNHNRMLGNYPGVNGIKTGYIDASGFNIVVSVSRYKHNLIGVVFGGASASGRDAAMARYLDKAFFLVSNQSPAREILRAGSLPVANQRFVSNGEQAQIALNKLIDNVSGATFSDTTPPPASSVSFAAMPPLVDIMPHAATPQKNTVLRVINAIKQKPAKPNNALLKKSCTGVNKNCWKIDIGSFTKQEAASRRGTQVTKLAPILLSGAKLKIDRDDGLHRTYFVGLSQKNAIKLCSILKKSKISCAARPS